MTNVFLQICEQLGVPIAMEKTEWRSDKLTFLGLLLDGSNFTVSVPEIKRTQTINMIQLLLSKKKVTIKELQSLAGMLNFLGRAIVPGRAFTRRMYSKFSGPMVTLKKFHHIRIDKEFKSDCKVWLDFLNTDVLLTVSRPFIDFSENLLATELEFF